MQIGRVRPDNLRMLEVVREDRGLARAAALAAEAAELLRRAAAVQVEDEAVRFDCDLARGGMIMCVELIVERPDFVVAIIAEEQPAASIRIDGERRIHAALPAAHGAASTVMLARRLAARIKAYGHVGISSFHAGPFSVAEAVREAEFVLDVVRAPGAPIAEEIGRGTYKLLLRMLATHPGALGEFYESTVAAMVTYDEHHGTELVATLSAYLTADCNMNVTAAAVFAHRHTIASRLERIRELTGLDPARYEDREQLGLGLKVHRLLATQLSAPEQDRLSATRRGAGAPA